MRIQKCDNCGYQFSWKEILKVSRWKYATLVCCECKTEHEVTTKTRYTVGFSTGTIVAISLFYLQDISFSLGLFFTIFSSLALMLLFPYIARFKA